MAWLPFQQQFMKAAFDGRYHTVAASWPRGAGKTTIMGHLIAEAMNPYSPHFRPGAEPVLVASSIAQARQAFRVAREILQPQKEHGFLDSGNRIAITHRATNTELRIIGSNAKQSFGLVNAHYAFVDEPGAMEILAGAMLWDSLVTAQGKVGSPLRILIVGTLGPMATDATHWWHSLAHSKTTATKYVQLIQGDRARWKDLRHAYAVNPVARLDSDTRAKMREERDEALRDDRLLARWMTYRLNRPERSESDVLIRVEDWERVCERAVPERKGRPLVAVDLGGGRAWSAATAHYGNGRVEAIALAPGIPSLAEQEKRDLVNPGTYQRLYDAGSLMVADGYRVQPPGQLVDAIRAKWGRPDLLVCDRFKLPELQDCGVDWPVEPRVTRWSEGTFDVKALRRQALDGPLSVDPGSRALLTASLSAAMVANDDAGNVRMVKKSTNNTARDDVAYALHLGCGALARAEGRPKARWRSRGIV